jgi:hypothetical protein
MEFDASDTSTEAEEGEAEALTLPGEKARKPR